MSGTHLPVLLAEIVAAVAPRDGDLIVDGTFGRGGYARGLLAAADCRVVGIDRDPEAVAEGRRLEAEQPGRFRIVEGRFGAMDELIGEAVDGIVLDLGVSSPQIDDPARGFSFRADGPLDMRMGRDGATAADLVNSMAEDDLANVIYDFGEERLSRRVARAIVAARKDARIERTLQLAEIVRRVVPRSKDGIDPATRTFQALRLWVNDELTELDHGLSGAERLLRPGGRLAVVTFHSLEDRRVKRFLAERSGGGGGVSRHIAAPSGEDRAPSFRLGAKRSVTPGEAETRGNPRARSARLRSAIRSEAPAWPPVGQGGGDRGRVAA
ncbi:16S rRNA (cytosine1402-N4)-methyltransferase [Inquilinus ginsengisoli]|jgi:16S rRNA (cytosine1402-N4)-methyltransferase|uniref:Ribosomal RNA small subunit methyltransferase H n=1 Tax=Inquilinus ginsengisoli TaxID=363840 RepID=A0ABU1JHA1_9PROT|nr:16S rRNA (cytosine(1402)-N(4))-methyltransferase RsmH [Inquilinus ginsengisoli]MDR6287995.1 16S rRNA (cytosine1402-N4)-methyltransferase [Inquilinus ginsengisoli]